MFLRSLSLLGFKTFARPTEIRFEGGVTAIVGPNGSGKTNIVDAIKWVLGSGQARDLRGKTMAEVIYVGGERRSRAAFAEVTLVFDNTTGRLPVDYHEVAIKRRVERDGESDYFLNGSRIRRRDLIRMLSSTGLTVDSYAIIGQHDIEEIETEVFGGDPGASRRIYELSREVIEFQRATHPLLGILDGLTAGFEKYGTDDELQRYLRDVADHATTVVERVDGFRQVLANILTVNATLVGQAQNEEVKRISAWAAILFAPTLIGTIYGMNFDYMPELHWLFGYPYALGLMALVCLTLFAIFKRRRWL